ncbi:MAG: hypothetical protein EAX95_00405 [Candidatus Thorarchaeota archaeon]|nr:hypothetical protein [Candidatus Thorarchaeota archaeon]
MHRKIRGLGVSLYTSMKRILKSVRLDSTASALSGPKSARILFLISGGSIYGSIGVLQGKKKAWVSRNAGWFDWVRPDTGEATRIIGADPWRELSSEAFGFQRAGGWGCRAWKESATTNWWADWTTKAPKLLDKAPLEPSSLH